MTLEIVLISGDSFKYVRLVRTFPETTTDQSPIDAVASIGFNGVLLLIRAQTHASEDASSPVSVAKRDVTTRRHLLQPRPP